MLEAMWALTNTTPFAAATTWTRDERGAEFWLVAIRACFEIDLEGHQRLAEKQTPVQRAPVFAGDPMFNGLLSDTDLVMYKAGTDVLVRGSAYAPRGHVVTRCSVSLKVHAVNKTLNVLGDRRLSTGLTGLSIPRPLPFAEMPLTWERTYGGWDRKGEAWEPSNPVGNGFATKAAHLDGAMAPNVEYQGESYRGPGTGRAAAFGPVAHHWLPRVRYAGTYDQRWQDTRNPLLPEDFDRRYFQSAPDDQQTPEPLVGYEQVMLGGLTPDGPLAFILPRISFRVVTTFRRYGDVAQKPTIYALWLMPDRRRFEIVYGCALEVLPGREEKLIGTTVLVRKQMSIPTSLARTGVWSAR
jgi:hypothetical protein